MAKAPTHHSHYENNPFFIASNGITLLFNLSRGIAIMMIVVSILGLFSGSWSPDTSDESMWTDMMRLMNAWSVSDWTLAIGSIAVISLAIAMVSALFGGVSSYTSAQLAKGKEVKLNQAFHIAFEHLWGYLWLQVVIFVKLVLWTLLFIVPGIIMSVRYSLAGVAFYDDHKHLRGTAAIKESLRLTRGAWLTTFAANTLFSLLTFGALSSVVTTSANAVLYKQFDKLGDDKPKAHWLSWATLILPFAILGLALVIIVAIAIGAALSGGR